MRAQRYTPPGRIPGAKLAVVSAAAGMSQGFTFNRSTTLVTGAQGFVGCWLAERLLDEGARVVAPIRDLDPRTRFRADGIDRRCELLPADVTDYETLLRALTEHRVTAVFHLAAQPIVGFANRNPHSTWESNVRGTYTVLEACRAARRSGAAVERIVVASSDHAYGSRERLPYREDDPLEALYPYDVSKACADLIARSYAHSHELPIAVTRMANTYGGGDLNWSRIVPDTARALARGERPVIRSDGTPERDYVYVADAVDAYLAIARSLDDPALRGRAWNCGLGEGVSVLELVETMIRVSGREVEPEVRGTGTPGAEIDRQCVDPSAMRDELGWAPSWDMERGLGAAYRWYEAHLAGEAATRARAPA
jgi:CDP-glucose 4,6-dehydratase